MGRKWLGSLAWILCFVCSTCLAMAESSWQGMWVCAEQVDLTYLCILDSDEVIGYSSEDALPSGTLGLGYVCLWDTNPDAAQYQYEEKTDQLWYMQEGKAPVIYERIKSLPFFPGQDTTGLWESDEVGDLQFTGDGTIFLHGQKVDYQMGVLRTGEQTYLLQFTVHADDTETSEGILFDPQTLQVFEVQDGMGIGRSLAIAEASLSQ